MIDEKKLIEVIKNIQDHMREVNAKPVPVDAREIFTLFVEMVEHQSKVGEWIPVSERLPDKNGRYLCFVDTKHVSYMYVFNFAKDLYKLDKYDFQPEDGSGFYEHDYDYGYSKILDVVAWMPLPEKYKGVD